MRYRVNKCVVCDHGRTHGQLENRMPPVTKFVLLTDENLIRAFHY